MDLSKIELLVFDVDGVLTDGRLYVGPDGQEMKAFSVLDGVGFKLLQSAGIASAVISGHASESVRHRFDRLGVKEVIVGVERKGPVLADVMHRRKLTREQVGVMGDDVLDLPLFDLAGFRATVPGAHPEILRVADFVTKAHGGSGAAREVIDMVLKARGVYDQLVQRMRE